MTTPFAKDQAAGLRRMLGQVASRRVLVIGAEEQIDDFVDNLRIALSAMGRDAAVVSAQTMLAVAGMLEQHDDSADVTLVAAHFGSRALGTVAEACDDVLLVFSDGPEGIKSAYTLLKKTAGLQGGAGIRTVVCGQHGGAVLEHPYRLCRLSAGRPARRTGALARQARGERVSRIAFGHGLPPACRRDAELGQRRGPSR